MQEQSRGLGELRDYTRDTRRIVDEMTKADEIAAAVLAAQHADRRAWFSWTRVGVAVVTGAVLLVPAVHDLVGWLGG